MASAENRCLHVTGLSPLVDETLLSSIFGAFGQLTSCRIIPDANGIHGYCDFADFSSASVALASLNGREVLGSPLNVSWHLQQAGPKEDTSNHITVFVGNIGDIIDEYMLFESFAHFNCSDSRIIRGDDGKCLGYGFVTIRTQVTEFGLLLQRFDRSAGTGGCKRRCCCHGWRSVDGEALADVNAAANRPPDPPPSTDAQTVAKQASESNTTVHVGNLVGTESEEALKKAFAKHGEIDNVRVPGKNFAFVTYTTHKAAAAAIAALNGTKPPGLTRPLKCTWAAEKKTQTTTATTSVATPANASMPYPPTDPSGHMVNPNAAIHAYDGHSPASIHHEAGYPALNGSVLNSGYSAHGQDGMSMHYSMPANGMMGAESDGMASNMGMVGQPGMIGPAPGGMMGPGTGDKKAQGMGLSGSSTADMGGKMEMRRDFGARNHPYNR
ncbi:hypothetical protein GUITHDRAFT_141953 [Guillardia theta CCMP2712]|uniref:RRM domain-containing protein n=2 Tax=Guillardia theta TaxID=55529 RepID=L1IYW9_GUITC|nr:hypothetical protein GUITHDRAFT_141953 [Guillardia theta CCMP2712]EKX41468.1 hypothetical protein GUITHDRAFT_141953 [Guillardia theta CCMP2712]|eukprot:XP_005828448.1 hypothetical protein GUITHDRAFT_141953 [Guillardia theta CCMP2712]